MEPIRTALVGYGFAGRVFHAPAIQAVPGLELTAIVQRHGNEAAPGVPVIPSVEAMLGDPSITLVVVATPSATHLPIARQCLLAGKNVVVDKPIGLSTTEAAELISLATAQHRLLTVFQNRRWDGDFLTVKKLLAEGKLGRIVHFESRYDRYRPLVRPGRWREDGGPGSGVLFDLGAHLVDQALVLFGMPTSVWASVRRERAGALSDDAFDLYLRYNDGLGVWLRATCLARAPGPRFTIYGTEGAYRKYGMDPQEAKLMAGDLYASHPWGEEDPEHWGTLTLEKEERLATEAGDYRGFYTNLRDALQGKAEPAVTGAQARQTLQILEEALASSASGC